MIIVVEPMVNRVVMRSFHRVKGDLKSQSRFLNIEQFDSTLLRKKVVSSMIGGRRLKAISFRIMFGGDDFENPVRLCPEFFSRYRNIISSCPFYVPLALRVLKDLYDDYGHVPLYAFFETSFFSRLPEGEKWYALPFKYSGSEREGIKKNGFHGIFHEFNSSRVSGHEKVLSLVLDKQTTVCPVFRHSPLSISLGATPLEGIMGRKSCGDMDPGIVFYLMRRQGFSIYEIDKILKEESGFLGLTGYDLGIKELFSLYGKDRKVDLAFDIYLNHIIKYIGEGIASLNGLDSIVFSGSHLGFLSPLVYRLLKKMDFLGVNLKSLPWENNKGISLVTSEESNIAVSLNFLSTPRIIALRTEHLLEYKIKNECLI